MRAAVLGLATLLLVSCGSAGPGPGPGAGTGTGTATLATATLAANPTVPAQTPGRTPTAPAPAATPVPGGASVPLPVTFSEAPGPPLGSPAGTPTFARDPAFEALAGAVAYHGSLGRSAFRVEFPSSWNGGLVLWAHGFRGFGPEVRASSPPRPLREAILASGYAWAASSFSENGYTPGIGADDTLLLKRWFEGHFGTARRAIIAGESMGGNVVVLSLEALPGEYAGGLSFCGAVGGIEVIDYLLSVGLIAEYITGIKLPIGDASGAGLADVLRIPSVLGTPGAFTPEGRRFESALRELTGGPRPFFAEGLAAEYSSNFGLLLADPGRTTAAVAAATNEAVAYRVDPATGLDPAQLNANIRRVPPVPGARDPVAHPDAVPTSGRLSAPLLALHNTGDLFVPISLEVAYAAKAKAAGAGDLLVQRAIRDGGHCKFSAEEYAAAWRDLVAWVEEGRRPAGETLGADLRDVGLAFTNPLRPGDPGGR